MKFYQIDSSARKDGSTSRALAKKLLDKIKKPEDEVIYRDLDDEMVFVSGLTESGMKIEEKDRTEHHKKMFELSDKLVSELKESDIIIISAPIYNYGPPATLKAWADLAARVDFYSMGRETMDSAIDLTLDNQPVPSEQKAGIGCSIKWKPGNEPSYL